MIAEAMAGIALFKASVEGIKSVIGTANDVSSFAKHIDNLFTAQSQVNKQRFQEPSGFKALKDQFSVSSVAEEMIDAKLVQEQMYEISTMIDYRFGHGTWASIIAERARRIQEMREHAKQELRAKHAKQKEIMEVFSVLAIVICVALLLIGGLIFWVKY